MFAKYQTALFCSWFLSGLLLSPTTTSAAECKENGCGPEGRLGNLIFDEYEGLFVQCKFKAACNKHDICYSTCLKCSKSYGTKICKRKGCWLRWDNKFKSKCDDELFQNISSANNNNPVCNGFARAYKWAVKILGCGYYYWQTFSQQKQLQFKRSFDSFMRYQEYHRKNKIPLDEKKIDQFLDQLSQSPATETNTFYFSSKKGAPTLFLRPIKSLRKSTPGTWINPPVTSLRVRRIINGIDVTDMYDKDDTFDSLRHPNGGKHFDFKIIMNFKGTPKPGTLTPKPFDYKTF